MYRARQRDETGQCEKLDRHAEVYRVFGVWREICIENIKCEVCKYGEESVRS